MQKKYRLQKICKEKCVQVVEIYTLFSEITVSGEYMLLGSVSSQQRFGVTDTKALGTSQLPGLGQTVLSLLDKSVLQLRVTALFYLENSRKIHLQGVRAC